MIAAVTAGVVEWCRRHAVGVVLLALALTMGVVWYSAGHLGMNTDTDALLAEDLPWRQREADFDRAFPQTRNLLAIVIDGATPDLADSAAAALADRLAERPELFHTVRRPDGSEFFRRYGLLFLPVEEVEALVGRLIEAQPLIGSLAADPSIRGLFDTLNLALEGVARGETELSEMAGPLAAVADTIEGVLAGGFEPISWQTLLTGREAEPRDLRRIILVQPVLEFASLTPGARGSRAVREAARDLGLTPENGVQVRLTGSVAIADEEFGSIAESLWMSGTLSLVLIVSLLFLAVGSLRLILAILVTLVCGLLATLGFAAAAVGTLNPISVGFAVMFLGIAVDFGIQFTTRFRDMRYRSGDVPTAMRRTALGISGPLLLAAATTAVGFLSFVPTAYVGVSQLGLIAGAGMVIAVILNLTLLPALLALVRPPGERAPAGYVWAVPIDRFLAKRRRSVLAAAVVLGLVGLALAPLLRFDFNPMHLRDPESESIATFFDLMDDPATSPFTIDILAPSLPAAQDLAGRLEDLPEVSQTVTLASFVPENQDDKLALIDDAAVLLGPSLYPSAIEPPPTPDEMRTALVETVTRLAALAPPPDSAAGRLAAAVSALLRRDAAALRAAEAALLAGLPNRLESLRTALEAEEPMTLDRLPEDLRQDWIAPDGRARIAVYPSGDPRDNVVLERFADAVRAVASEATGTAVSLVESGRTVVAAFSQAGLAAVLVIAVLLAAILRRGLDVALVMAPLLLSGLLTLALCVAFDLPINFANIIALPLLLGIGVAFNIYLVMNWRAGVTRHLQSGTARAILFSALTTAAGFGSLALSTHPGTAFMGVLLTLALGCTLVSTLFVLPALLAAVGSPGNRQD